MTETSAAIPYEIKSRFTGETIYRAKATSYSWSEIFAETTARGYVPSKGWEFVREGAAP